MNGAAFTRLRYNTRGVLRTVEDEGRVEVTKRGERVAVIVRADEYERLARLEREASAQERREVEDD